MSTGTIISARPYNIGQQYLLTIKDGREYIFFPIDRPRSPDEDYRKFIFNSVGTDYMMDWINSDQTGECPGAIKWDPSGRPLIQVTEQGVDLLFQAVDPVKYPIADFFKSWRRDNKK